MVVGQPPRAGRHAPAAGVWRAAPGLQGDRRVQRRRRQGRMCASPSRDSPRFDEACSRAASLLAAFSTRSAVQQSGSVHVKLVPQLSSVVTLGHHACI